MYYDAAWRAIAGDPAKAEANRASASAETRAFAAQLRDDYADYLLGMQPDDEEKVARNRDSQRSPSDNDKALNTMGVVGGMYAYPQLAAFFGLIIDVTIPAQNVPNNARFMRADFGGGGGVLNAPVWTAIDPQSDGTLQVRASNVQGPDSQCSFGLLHLGDTKRFDIVSLNVNAAVDGWMSAARSDRQAREDGARRSDLASGVSGQHGVGLSIVDRFRREAGANELTSENRPDGHTLQPSERVLYLEDLIAGYRIDVATQMGREHKWRWLSLMDREVNFPEVEGKLKHPTALAAPPVWPVDRFGGSVQTMHRDVQVSDENQPPLAVVYETLACWRNWSLAVPAHGANTNSGDGEIQLERTIAPKRGSLPSFRFDSLVKLGARCMLINGSSVRLKDAAEIYEGNSSVYVLAQGPGVPLGEDGFPILRHEPLPTPRLFKHKPPPEEKDEADDARNVVVRTGYDGKVRDAREERVILPGETTFDMAELHGALDDFEDLPEPPYQQLTLSPKLGTAAKLPVMQDLVTPQDSVLSYPDPKARFMTMAFTENGQPAEQFGFSPPVIVDLLAPDSRGRDRHWPDMAGLSLELVAVPLEALPLHNRIVGTFDTQDIGPDRSGLALVKVRLAPAEQIDLTIWSLPETVADLATQAPMAATVHFAQNYSAMAANAIANISEAGQLAEILKSFEKKPNFRGRRMDELAATQTDADRLLRALRRLPIPALSSYQTLRLVHAVERPLAAPALEVLWAVHSPDPHPSQKDHETGIRVAWTRNLIAWGIGPEENPTSQSADAEKKLTQGSNRIFFGGRVRFHRKSTSRLDLTGVWEDWRDDIAPRKDKTTGKFCFIPEPHAETLMSMNDIDYRPTTGDGDVVGLAFGHGPTLKPTFVGYTFKDTRARSITVNARAVSRFRGQFDANEDSLDERFALSSDGAASGSRTLIVRSTERPKQLPSIFCAPSLHYEIENYDPEDLTIRDKSGVRHRRTVRLRCDVGDRFFERGIKERVGVVCWPPHLFDAPEIPEVRQMVVEEIDAEIAMLVDTNGSGMPPKGAARYVTRWGRDPIHDSGDLPALIPASAFRNCVKSVKTVMPLPADKKPGSTNPDKASNSTLNVSLALYDPKLDPDTGRFYVDIEIDQHETYEPHINLGLVRYQEHSIEGVECSLPTRNQVRVPADRQLELEVADDGRISLRYSGVGYHGAYIPRILHHNSNGAPLSTSTLSVTVMRTPVDGVSGAPALIRPLAPGVEPDGLAHIDLLEPRTSDGLVEWVVGRFADGAVKDPNLKELFLPADCVREHISVLVTESEHYVADNFLKTFGSNRTNNSDFEEPSKWADASKIDGTDQTLKISRDVSAVHLRMRPNAPNQEEQHPARSECGPTRGERDAKVD
ncbi:hypothetical protein NKI79_18770 [Mesorhizobium sp. M0340]